LVIVEGTCGSGKTTLLRSAPSIFAEASVLPQRVTYARIAPREDDGTLDDTTNREILRDIVGEIRGELSAQRLVLVDTLHATHFVRAGALSVGSFVEIDRALHELDALVVVLRVSEPSIRARTIIGRRGTGFYEYARKFGATEDDRTRYFAREQERLVELLDAHSCLRRVELDSEEPPDVLQQRFRDAVQAHLRA